MMDFKGIWRTRSGKIAEVREFVNTEQLWVGKITGIPGECEWTKDTAMGPYEDDDLMERLSDRWSKERSGGE